MLTQYSVFELSRRGYHLLRNTQGNNGRELRRFVASVTSPSNLVLQVLSDYGSDLTDTQSATYEAYAEKLRDETCLYLDETVAPTATTCVDRMFGIVQNSFKLWDGFDVTKASVKELRRAVEQIVAMSDCMHRFAGNPAGELETVTPEYAERVRQARERQNDLMLDLALSHYNIKLPAPGNEAVIMS